MYRDFSIKPNLLATHLLFFQGLLGCRAEAPPIHGNVVFPSWDRGRKREIGHDNKGSFSSFPGWMVDDKPFLCVKQFIVRSKGKGMSRNYFLTTVGGL